MPTNNYLIKLVIDLHKQGHSVLQIARSLNLHIEEVANIINDYIV
jgi:hypothetical protein